MSKLKEEYESQLESVAMKYSQDIAVLKGQMATETTQHEVGKVALWMYGSLQLVDVLWSSRVDTKLSCSRSLTVVYYVF